MLRTRLLTATAAVAVMAAGSAFAQTAAPTSPAAPMTTPPVAPQEPIPGPAPTASTTATAQSTTQAQATTPAAQNTIVDVLRENGQFTTLLTALDAAQLTDTLRTQPAISIFAPTDAAFAALPEAERTRLLDPANVNELRQLLLYHVVVADVNSSQIEGAKGGVQTAATTEVQLDGTGDAIKVDNATVTTADIDAGNGAVFIIDSVLNPATSLVASGDAEEATTPAADDTATPPATDTDTDMTTAPAEGSTTMDAEADTMDADSATDEGAMTPPATTTAPAPTATTPMTSPTPSMSGDTTTTTMPSTTASPNATTMTTRPATGVRAPNGQPASTVTTVASPTVPNPTDGQRDNMDDEDAGTTTAPRPQS